MRKLTFFIRIFCATMLFSACSSSKLPTLARHTASEVSSVGGSCPEWATHLLRNSSDNTDYKVLARQVWNELNPPNGKDKSAVLDRAVAMGNSLYLHDGDWRYELGENLYGIWTGVFTRRFGIWKMAVEKKNMVLKGLGSDPIMAHQAYSTSNLVHALGLGPRAQLVKRGEDFFLVYEDVPGINLKDLILVNTSSPKKQIEKILGRKYVTYRGARRAYANLILKDKVLIEKLFAMTERLDRALINSSDLQIVVLPSLNGEPGKAGIIDPMAFWLLDEDQQEWVSGVRQLRYFLSELL